jgi:transposase InsO family protein
MWLLWPTVRWVTTRSSAKSFFATLECELLDRSCFHTQAEARPAVFEFIEGWYNTQRRHSALDYDSPIEYERRHAQAFRASTPESGFAGCPQSLNLGPA